MRGRLRGGKERGREGERRGEKRGSRERGIMSAEAAPGHTHTCRHPIRGLYTVLVGVPQEAVAVAGDKAPFLSAHRKLDT